MARLNDSVSTTAPGRSAGGPRDGTARLRAVEAFGSNPGGLRMKLYAPAHLPAGAPLVVVLHGCGQSAEGYAIGAGWLALARLAGFAVLAPEQTRANNPNLCFTWFEPADVARDQGEAASIAEMVRRAVADHGIDPRRVFITGLSAGGAMAAALLAAYPELFAAGAVIAGLPCGAASTVQEALAAMRGKRALPARAWGDRVRAAAPGAVAWPRIAVWYGDADHVVAPAAGEALVQQWANVHGLTASEAVSTASSRHVQAAWRDAAGEARVERHVIAGMGHGTPVAPGAGDGGGSAGPWLLDVGVPSTLEIARGWGITSGRPASAFANPAAPRRPPAAPPAPPPSRPDGSRGVNVGEVIARALKSAGLLR